MKYTCLCYGPRWVRCLGWTRAEQPQVLALFVGPDTLGKTYILWADSSFDHRFIEPNLINEFLYSMLTN
ncbi:hypothetical protein HanXRQr2_Chr08g0352011 [Helianthus annuus]|uniref:Uncharacterized protein n=1 Tax=Helianthus annuus TaxID=4232 RepID=A0A251U7Y0_HELAN|nr:hypothetical protein HanXRQr2_Chr08g0352011 [Helianthus annuus]KAJ0902683.1 hypothetical protein HanPSC8_Chr08g0339931 [Helianthus annuus]